MHLVRLVQSVLYNRAENLQLAKMIYDVLFISDGDEAKEEKILGSQFSEAQLKDLLSTADDSEIPHILRQLGLDPVFFMDLELPELLTKRLAEAKDPQLRMHAATIKNLPETHLRKLASDTNHEIRSIIAARESLPEDIQRETQTPGTRKVLDELQQPPYITIQPGTAR